MFTPIADHVAEAKARLIQQYKGKTGVEGLVVAFTGEFQNLEDVAVQLNTQRDINTAIGVQLDLLGTIIGLTRVPGETDDSYRARLKAEIGVNVSEGEPERVIETFKALTMCTFVILEDLLYASIGLQSDAVIGTQQQVNIILDFLENIAPAGVRVDFITTFDLNQPFAFDGDHLGLGFDDRLAPGTGGMFAYNQYHVMPFSFAGPVSTDEGFGTTKDPLVGGVFST